MSLRTCRGCGSAFTKFGAGAQSINHPRLCKDCAAKEIAWHGYHAPGIKCLDSLLGITKEKVSEGAS